MDNSLSWLVEFLQIVCSGDLTSDPEQFNNAVSILKHSYSHDTRHKYSAIASLLRSAPFNDYFPDQFDIARENFRTIVDGYAKEEIVGDLQKWIDKLFDYLELEFDRITNIEKKIKALQDSMSNYSSTLQLLQYKDDRIDQLLKISAQLNETTNDALETSKAASQEAQNASRKAQKAAKRIKDFNTQSVTILSIFTAVVFAFTGGFTMLGSAFGNLSGITRSESLLLLVLVLIVGLILADIIYFLICFIGRLSDVYIGVSCSHDCTNCVHKKRDGFTCGILKQFRHKHFVMKCINTLIVGIVALILLFNISTLPSNAPEQEAIENEPIVEIQQVSDPTSFVSPTSQQTIKPTPKNSAKPSLS